ncbi:MAG: hypothetical protein ACTHNH_05230 [Mesorhizobium sp.]
MTGVTVQNMEEQLISAIAACEREVRRGEADLARLKDALRALRRQKTAPSQPKNGRIAKPLNNLEEKRSDGEIEGVHENSAASIIRKFARQALKEAGRPLNRAEIWDLLRQAGISIDSKVPIKRIAKVMWSSDEFQNVGDGYWFSGKPIPNPSAKDSI